MIDTSEKFSTIRKTVDIVVAHVRTNTMSPHELVPFIKSIHNHLAIKEVDKINPAVAVEDSVTSEYIVCLEDGRRLKSMKRHLRTNFKLTPEQYRAKWGLSPDYPMVAPNYAKKRSSLARGIGLGKYKR